MAPLCPKKVPILQRISKGPLHQRAYRDRQGIPITSNTISKHRLVVCALVSLRPSSPLPRHVAHTFASRDQIINVSIISPVGKAQMCNWSRMAVTRQWNIELGYFGSRHDWLCRERFENCCDPVKLVDFGGSCLEARNREQYSVWCAVIVGARRKLAIAKIYFLVVAVGTVGTVGSV